MKFDNSKVYTAVNADEVKVGSKGYGANNLGCLEENVINEDILSFFEIKEILSNYYEYRFQPKGVCVTSYALFYLVEEPEEKKFRPYRDTVEMIEDFKRRYNSYGGWNGKDNPMYNPLIWIKDKFDGTIHLITDFGDDCVWNGESRYHLGELCRSSTYLDNSPCGIEE